MGTKREKWLDWFMLSRNLWKNIVRQPDAEHGRVQKYFSITVTRSSLREGLSWLIVWRDTVHGGSRRRSCSYCDHSQEAMSKQEVHSLKQKLHLLKVLRSPPPPNTSSSGPSVQTHKPIGAILYSNHKTVHVCIMYCWHSRWWNRRTVSSESVYAK